jgi:predicted nucleotidyltransferase
MFSVDDRDRVREHVLELASSDPRVVAAAVIGSLAHGDGDRWSDLDLTFAVEESVPVVDVLSDWTSALAEELDAVQLFDLPSGATIYRVLLLPGCLQVDLSFTPAPAFGARGPRFSLVFGSAVEKVHSPHPSADGLFGLAVHHAVRARVCIERGRWWQAEYWISGVRDEALALACLHRGLSAVEGRGFDELPADVLDGFSDALVRSLDREELLRALARAIAGLLRESGEARVLATKVKPQLEELASR